MGNPSIYADEDRQTGGELLQAALAYVCSPGEAIWPWDIGTFDPSNDPVVNIVKAGVLVAAEGDRLLRRRELGLPVVGGMIVLSMDPESILSDIEGMKKIAGEMESLRTQD